MDTKYNGVNAFHATQNKNYMAALKAIFMFAQLIGTNGSISKKQQILNAMPNIDSTTRNDVDQIVTSINQYIDSKGSTSKEQKKYIAYGFRLHLMGDIYAHRTLVKKANWDKRDTQDDATHKYLQMKDFQEGIEETLGDNIATGSVTTGALKDYMRGDGYTYITNYPQKGTVVTKMSRVYPDNPYFMPKRVDAMKRASVSFVKQARQGSNFTDVVFFLGEYNISLGNFDMYKSSIQ